MLGTYTGIGNSSSFNQHEVGTGFSLSGVGSTANELENQGEIINTNFNDANFTHNYNALSSTFGNSNVDGLGEGIHNEYNNTDGCISTLGTVVGMHSVSNASMGINHDIGVSAMGAETGAGTGAGTVYHSDYTLNNIGSNSGINQAGFQNADINSGASVAGTGYGVVGVQYDNIICEIFDIGHNVMGMTPETASANVFASQNGNTVGDNNGQGTAMSGSGLAVGSMSGNVTGNASITGSQNQGHMYHQESGIGTGQEQWANGEVYTGNTISLGM